MTTHTRRSRRLALLTVAATLLIPATSYAAPNPDPARNTAESWWLMEQLLELQSGTVNGGLYVDKPGYHNTRAGNSPDNYSVRDAEDRDGPSDKMAAYDWTFTDARNGSYGTINRYSQRLLAAGRANDPRVAGWKEFFGQSDGDNEVEAWDFRRGTTTSTSDLSHLWHIHLSEDRDKVTSMANKVAMLSVLKGETVAQWRGTVGDYDGNGQTDRAVWRPSTGEWRIQYYGSNGTAVHQWGQPGDVPVPGDYNGDGQFDRVVWRPSTGEWWIQYYGSNGTAKYTWGQNGDVPVPGDYNGDGLYDRAVWRPSTGEWRIQYYGSNGTAVHQWGQPGDIPAPGDYNGDGQFDRVIFRPSTGQWWVQYYRTNGTAIHAWGRAGDIPVT